ncbi:MAG TPA: class I SAM-dependent methyltransferase [Anaerolineaceae bacterium]
MAKKDYLWLQIKDLPYFRGFLRAIEARFYEEFDLPQPTLDLGCGDGHFVQIALDRKVEVGLDPWWDPLQEAVSRSSYSLPLQGFGNLMPFGDGTFNSVFSNSVLEHIPDLDPVIHEVSRVLKPGGIFAFCVPNHNFLSSLSIARFLDKIGLKRLASAYRRFFNRIARHYHCDDPVTWETRLDKAGFLVERWWHYFPPNFLAIMEWGHYFGFPALVSKKLFGRWILSPTRWNLALTDAVVRRAYESDPRHPLGTCTFYIARKR